MYSCLVVGEIVDHLLEILKTALEVQFLEYVRLSVHGGSLGSQLSDWFFEKEDHVVDAHGISSAERTLVLVGSHRYNSSWKAEIPTSRAVAVRRRTVMCTTYESSFISRKTPVSICTSVT